MAEMIKVLSRYSDGLYSYNWFLRYALRYSVGERTIPHFGKLMVFDTVKNAEVFVARNGSSATLELWRVEAENPEPVESVGYATDYQIELFWFSKESPLLITVSAPTGTHFADAVTLIERIE